MGKGKIIGSCFSCMISAFMILNLSSAVISAENTNNLNNNSNPIRVTTTAELHTALKNAEPGDEIIIAEGTYVGKLGSNASGHGSSFFNSDKSGTPDAPIILKSENENNKSVLIGERANTGNVLRITGDNWIIENLKITGAQKGIMLDNANNNIIKGCDVYQIGMEGIHLRDNSCNNLVENCTVTDTGILNASYGEAIYIGSAKSAWSTYGEACNDNIIRSCKLGPNVSAEHIDVKEGTQFNIIENCIMDGTGISGQNYADSFVDVKGNNTIVRNNTCYRNKNSIITDAFQVHNQLDSWGQNNFFYDNALYLDDQSSYIVNASQSNTSAEAKNNVRYPDGNMYIGNVKDLNNGETDIPDPDPAPDKNTFDINKVYNSGDTVIFEGNTYKARWWTQGAKPDPNNLWGVWELIETTVEKPTPKPEPEPEIPSADTYISSAVYSGGDTVIYQGKAYKAKWWTQGTAPDPSNTWGPWELIY